MNASTRTVKTLELVGGVLCLEFVNTTNSRREPEHDYLLTYSDLMDWAEKVGILSGSQVKGLKQRTARAAMKAKKALEKGRSAREILYRMFSAIASKSKPNEDDLNAITHLYEQAISNGQFIMVENHYEINWEPTETFDAYLWPIVASAEKLLSSQELSRVKECPNCGWLFLDTSKNQSRRWCSMNTCGARDKMRRYHKRLRTK